MISSNTSHGFTNKFLVVVIERLICILILIHTNKIKRLTFEFSQIQINKTNFVRVFGPEPDSHL